ncbi:zinc transporter ZIP12-like [Anneissia japonica]|uniref:zinc transporter ZIP12-like n=1 Tax=Anneissia japonica TaxID=1529436 RepID=UPI00142582FC|nr:zinc transporter ZIP12-like [Anneissia japonica]XP_033118398.1 zinc transporter ZIP12-like [Anneissia japonica]
MCCTQYETHLKMAAKLFFRLVCIVQLLAVAQFSLFASAEHDHDKEHIDAFQLSNGFLNELEVQTKEYPENITISGISLLVENILKRTNCSGQTGLNETICKECFDPDHLFDIVGAKTVEGLNEELYHKLSVVLLNTISSQYETCLTQNTYEQHYASYVGNDDDFTEEEFKLILREVATIYDADIHYKCFTAEGSFEDIVVNHTNGANIAEVQELAGAVIYNLLRGYCIGEPTATNPESFINEIFEMYVVDDDVIHEEGFESMLESLGIGEKREHGDENTNNIDDNHNHRKKRNVDDHDHEEGDDHDHEEGDDHDDDHGEKQCYSGESLLDIFGIDHESGLHQEDLERICPALLQQVLSKSCEEEHQEEETVQEEEDKAKVWLAGLGSVIIISLASLGGVVILPCIGKESYYYIIQLLIALAVATLAGDAILHLLPQAFGLHAHGASEDTHDDEDHGPLSEELAFVWKGFAVMGAIYAFFLLEKIMGMLMVTHRPLESNHNHHHDFPMKENKQLTASTTHLKEDGIDDEDSTTNGGFFKRLSSMAIMILLGDTMHNFGDGLAIGAAFALSMGTGVATSIAVLCHELPHEFGDFAVLLNSGLKFKEALLLNFLSSLTAIVGVCIGIEVGENEEARQWIFAVVAGMFLYVALGDMMPELMHPSKGHKWLVFLVQNIGFLVGTAIILIIALYEDSISIEI